MVTFFEEKDIISFGAFMVSELRVAKLKEVFKSEDKEFKAEDVYNVYSADIKHWQEFLKEQSENAQIFEDATLDPETFETEETDN